MDIFGKKALQKQLDGVLASMQGMLNQRLNTSFYQQIAPNYSSVKEQMIYRTMDDVYSVVSRLATTAAMIPYYGVGVDGEAPMDNDKILGVEKQLTFQTKEMIHMNLLISGEVFLWKKRIELGPNAGTIKLFNLNPSAVSINISSVFPYEITGFIFNDNMGNGQIEIPASDMVYIKLENPTIDQEGIARGLSPIKVLSYRLTRMQAEMDISVAQLQNGGLPGILYDENPTFSPEIANIHKENFARYLNNTANKNAPYFMGGKVGYISIGSTLADLDLAQLADLDFDKICNAYSVSSTWFNNHSAATESNVKEMIKQVYTNAVLPNVMRVQDALNSQLVPDLGTTSKIVYDLSDITELQADMQAKANGYSAMPVIIPNEVREGLGYARIDDPLMDMPLIKMGYQPIDELAAVPNLPITPDYGGTSGQTGI
mgnify:CR=1 FL=1